MSNDNNSSREMSRRQILSAAVITVSGGAVSLVGAQEAQQPNIELEAYTGGWEGVIHRGPPDPPGDKIEGETNPTLTFEDGVDYTVTWTNEDGQPHNFVIEDSSGEEIVQTEVISEGSQTVEFTATGVMAEYYCEVHPQSMRGDVRSVVVEGLPSNDVEEEEPSGDDEESEIDRPGEYQALLRGEPHNVKTTASGEARFQVNEDGTEATYEVMVESICNVTQAHIHLGAEGEDGPVVVWLYPEEGMEPELIDGAFSGTLAEGTITEENFVGEWEGVAFEDVLMSFEEETAYVNVHTEEHPGGEIRGQIMPPHG